MSYQNVLVGIDGSKQAKFAFYKAAEIAKQNHAALHLLSIINGQKFPDSTPQGYGFADNHIYDSAVATMQEQLSELEKIAKDDGITDISKKVLIGNAKEELAVKYPQAHQIDLLVVGMTGLNAVGRMVIGSSAAYCVQMAPCDVTVVKTDNSNQPLEIKKKIHR